MNLEETTAFLNRVTPFDWEYVEPAHGRWKFIVNYEDHPLTVYLRVGEKPSDKYLRDVLKTVDEYFKALA